MVSPRVSGTSGLELRKPYLSAIFLFRKSIRTLLQPVHMAFCQLFSPRWCPYVQFFIQSYINESSLHIERGKCQTNEYRRCAMILIVLMARMYTKKFDPKKSENYFPAHRAILLYGSIKIILLFKNPFCTYQFSIIW